MFMRSFILSFLILSSSVLIAKSTICLNMIVKNESAVIEECLSSVKPYIDCWVIVDTGSTDGTQKIIQDYLRDIPGELHERPWKDFAHNRNEALRLAKDKADYLLWIDADDWLEFDDDFTMPELTRDAYLLKIAAEGRSCYRLHFLKSDLPWKWEGVVHEVVSCDQPIDSENLEGARYRCTREGIRAKSSEYYQKQAKLLEAALKEDPNNNRTVFYLAQAYRDAGDAPQALKYFQKRTQMGGWKEEVFLSLLQIAKIQNSLNADSDTIFDSLYKAHRYYPLRREPVYYIAEIYNTKREYALAYECLKGAQCLPLPPLNEPMVKEDWVEDWGLIFQLSISSYYMGRYQESLRCHDELLDMPDIPDTIRKQIRANREFACAKVNSNSAHAKSEFTVEKPLSSDEGCALLSEKIAEMIKEKIEELNSPASERR